MRTVEATATASGSRDAVWALIEDVSAWSRWGSWSGSEVEGGGDQGPGAVRVLVRRPYRLRERITEWVPGERMAYELLDRMPVQGYRSVVTLEDASERGTLVRWRSTYEKASPIAAVLLRLAVPDACRRLAMGARR